MGHKVEAGPERVRDHIPRPHPNKMIIDQIRSTVNLIDPALDLGLIGPREELIVTRPSKFAPEFKARAIDLYRSSEGRTIADVARELGIGTETFRKWVRQDEADRGERDDRLTSKDAEELKRLRRENAELKRTNEILRLASAFFAQEADPTRRRS
jgi:transposase